MNIENHLLQANNKSVLFLGRIKNFTTDEIKLFLKQYQANFTDTLTDDVVVVIESSMQTPVEEDLSYTLYKQKMPSFKLEEFETLYAKKIAPNSLLMSVKLSNDQSRIIRLLKNESFENSLYLKLFKMYDWQNNGVYDSDENRDVTISFVKRFYQKDRFMDPSIIYSPVTLSSIITESTDIELLDAVLSMPNYEMKLSKKEHKKPKNLRELVAANPHISEETFRKLLSFKDLDLDYFLSTNPNLSLESQKILLNRSQDETKKMLAHNEVTDDSIFFALLQSKNDEVIQYLLVFQTISKKRLEMILEENLKEDNLAYIGENETIKEYIDILLKQDSYILKLKLASNSLLDHNQLLTLEQTYDDIKMQVALASNPKILGDSIEKFFALHNQEIDIALASNKAVPKEMLESFFQRDDFEINQALASNESLDLYYLQQLQLDTRLMNILANNKTYTDNILNGLGI
jgi:hypothetical protein